jgi:DNA-binding NarL/FixJ family response regulator
MDSDGELETGRDAYARRAWGDAFGALSRSDRAVALEAPDLQRLATAAYMLGREEDFLATLERAHSTYLDSGEVPLAARCAIWIGLTLALRGDVGPASGWLARAERLLDQDGRECVERGYLLLPLMFRHEATGDLDAAAATAAEAAAVGERFREADLVALAVQGQGQMLIRAGRVREGLVRLDEAMLAATRTELSPIVTGIVYCGMILACREVYELRRAQEWTEELSRWCEGQPDLVAFTGRCLVHRAEIMQLRGAWADALGEARQASARRGLSRSGAGQAFYRQGEVLRLQGDYAAAEEAYREASRQGCEPQPGLALLRLAQGQGAAAGAAIRRVTAESTDRLGRAGLLPAVVEIMLAEDRVEEAREACGELEEIARDHEGGALEAMAMEARGAVELAGGDPRDALVALRRAWQAWEDFEAPYEAARVRVLLALACRALDDEDSAELELTAAREAFAELGAGPDLARVESFSEATAGVRSHGLTPRELEVLRLVAGGRSNREIAAELVISEHTVARHLQNIFAKLGLSSRTAAGVFAYEHNLI